jgi:hypothetical protein
MHVSLVEAVLDVTPQYRDDRRRFGYEMAMI